MSDSLFRLRPDQLAGLLRTGTDAEVEQEAKEQSFARAIQARLASEVLAGTAGPAGGVPGHHRGGPNLTMAQALLGGADAATLRLLKNHEKAIASHSSSNISRTVATTLYYAAIAAALLSSGEKITEHGYGDLEQVFAALAAKPWLPADLRMAFAKAQQVSLLRATERNTRKAR